MQLPIAAPSGEARHAKAVYLCADERFYPYALFVIDQIASKLPNRDFDLVILSPEPLPDHPLIATHAVRLVSVDLAGMRDQLHTDSRIPLAAYLRILAPDLFADQYRRLLYLDCDMFYQRGDLSTLLDLDMKGHAIAAVRDLPQMRKPHRVPKDFQILNLPQTRYFNSGVLLIDVAQWRSEQVAQRAIAFAAEAGEKLTMHDQTALNAVFMGKWLELNPVWNFIFTHQTMYFTAMFDICFYHFAGRRKPFKGNYGGIPIRFTQPYRDFFTRHWPSALETTHDGLNINRKWYLHIFVLLLHLRNVRRFLRHEAEWRSDWDTR